MSIEIGQPAPDFTLPKAGGGTVTLSALRGRKVIVYFYPKADTSGCTKEACGFNDALPDFDGVDATIIGISKDRIPGRFRTRGVVVERSLRRRPRAAPACARTTDRRTRRSLRRRSRRARRGGRLLLDLAALFLRLLCLCLRHLRF